MSYIGNKPADSYLTLEKQTFTTSATDTYVLDREVSGVNDIELFLNNVRQEPTEAYTISGTTLTLASAITASDSMYCIYQGRAVGTQSPAVGSVTNAMLVSGSFSNITGTGTLTNFTSTGIDDNATSTAITVDSSNNVLVGTTSTGATTAEDGAYITTSGIIVGRRANGVVSYFNRRSTDGQVVSFYRDTTNSGNISLSGSSTAYNTSSDYRLKENVVEMTGATERLKQLQPKRFNFINELETKDGFLAHEVSDIVPEAITGKKDEVDADGNPVYQGIDQSKLVPLLTASLKEAIAKIEELETRIATLENA